VKLKRFAAVLNYWAPSGANNPTSGVYSGRMIEAFGIWTWDARPYPAWPGRADLWSDGDLYPLGHWLNGKVGLADLAARRIHGL
jgi:GTA TIM-barrel-like domain